MTAATTVQGPGAKAPEAAAPARKKRASARRRPAATAPVPVEGHHTALLGVVAIALAAAFHVWTGLRVAELGYQRSRAIALHRHLETEREELADQLEKLLRTERLEAESERRLGLGLPTAGQVVDLRTKPPATGSSWGEP